MTGHDKPVSDFGIGKAGSKQWDDLRKPGREIEIPHRISSVSSSMIPERLTVSVGACHYRSPGTAILMVRDTKVLPGASTS
jgi:hypothetical protein